jgi:hypothetical protein
VNTNCWIICSIARGFGPREKMTSQVSTQETSQKATADTVNEVEVLEDDDEFEEFEDEGTLTL